MANAEQLALLRKSVGEWNVWRLKNPDAVIDLSGADLRNADLRNADLSGANLSEVCFYYANLGGADLRGAYLRAAVFRQGDLRGANFTGANLSEASFVGDKLSDANFAGAYFGRTVIEATDLGVAKGLESVRHSGPSSIELDTIYKSQGKIPDNFLRGCCVPDNFIEYMRSRFGKAV